MTPRQAASLQAMKAGRDAARPADQLARRMRYWSAAKLAKELARRDVDTRDPQAIAWAAAMEAERDRRYGATK